MQTADYILLIVGFIAIVYGLYIGIRSIIDTRNKSISEYKKGLEKRKKDFENGRK